MKEMGIGFFWIKQMSDFGVVKFQQTHHSTSTIVRIELIRKTSYDLKKALAMMSLYCALVQTLLEIACCV